MSTRERGVLDPMMATFAFTSGLNDKVISFNKFGFNPDVDTATEEDVWDAGGLYVYLDNASTLEVVSTDAGDGPGGVGISVVSITGVDADYNMIEELVTLNGTTPVTTTNAFLRTYRMIAISSDSGGPIADAEGTITANATSGGALQAVIQEGNTSTKMSMFTIPRGYWGFVTSINVSGGPNDDFVIDFQVRDGGTNTVFVTAADAEVSNSNSLVIDYFPSAGPIPQMSDIKMKAQAVSNNAQVRVGYVVTLVRLDYLQSLANSI